MCNSKRELATILEGEVGFQLEGINLTTQQVSPSYHLANKKMVHPHSVFRLVFMSFMAYLRCSSGSHKASKAHPHFGSI